MPVMGGVVQPPRPTRYLISTGLLGSSAARSIPKASSMTVLGPSAVMLIICTVVLAASVSRSNLVIVMSSRLANRPRYQVRERVARVFLATLLCAKLQTRPDEAVGYSLDP